MARIPNLVGIIGDKHDSPTALNQPAGPVAAGYQTRTQTAAAAGVALCPLVGSAAYGAIIGLMHSVPLLTPVFASANAVRSFWNDLAQRTD